jgi:predicted porin
MKKHIIAAAVAAAVAAPAMAQVTVYGILDMGYFDQSQSLTGASATRTKDSSGFNSNTSGLSSSRLGFKGSEDIGGGMKVGFALETGLTTSGASNNLAGTNRAANVSLAGGFGTFTLGRQNSLGKSQADGFSAFGGGASHIQGSAGHEALLGAELSVANSTSTKPIADRVSDALTYVTPSMNGFTASIQYQSSKSDDSSTAGTLETTGTALGLNYTVGGLSIGAAFSKADSEIEFVTGVAPTAASAGTIGVTQVTGREIEAQQIGAKYALGATTLFASYNKAEYKADTATAGLENDAFDIGVTHKMGAVTLLASIGQGEINTSATEKVDLDAYMLQAHYALSKRSTLYAMYGKTEGDKSGGTSGDVESDAFMIGLRHSF